MSAAIHADQFLPWTHAWCLHRAHATEATRLERYRALCASLAAALAGDATQVWRTLPGLVHEHLGYAWNGIYTLAPSGDLLLTSAKGPPVCGQLPPPAGLGQGGMCHDAVLMGQALYCADVKTWPGYISCDGESGLRTQSGLVVPIRDAAGRIIAVFDVDATDLVPPEDASFFEMLLATLSRVTMPTASVLGLSD